MSDTQLNTRRHAGRGELAWRKSALLVTMVASVACGGNVDHSTAGNDGSSTGGMQDGADTAGDGGSSGGGTGGSAATGGGGSAGSEANGGATGEAGSVGAGGTGGAPCPSPTPATAPLRRLTRFEYNNTVRDLLGDESSPAEALPADVLSLDAADDYVSTALVEGYHELAHDFALGIGEDAEALEALLGCSLVEEGEDACRERLFDGLLPRVFRRPLSSEDVADFEAVFERGQELGGDFASGVRAVLEVALQSPEFLYLLEFGEPAPELGDAWARLTPYELATRLSYLYWGSLPDAELLEAAATRELSTKEQVQAQATRLLADERAREVVHHFYDRLFGLQISPLAAKEQYPGFTEQVAELMLQETERFIDSVTWEAPGDFRTLLTASHSFSNEPLATFYGIEGVTGDEFRRVELDPARRAGILTQPSLWASMSFSLNTSPTRRGHFVVRKMLCMQVPPEPDGLPLPDLPPDLDPPPTTRERYAQHSQDPRCASCHSLMDPVGFAFGNYDAAGRWQDTENGITIDASGEIHGTDAAGTFVGAVELAERLAESDDAKRCYVQNWMEFAYRRGEAMEDTCTPSLLNDAFLSSEGSVRELLLALSQTEAFLYRPKSEVAP